ALGQLFDFGVGIRAEAEALQPVQGLAPGFVLGHAFDGREKQKHVQDSGFLVQPPLFGQVADAVLGHALRIPRALEAERDAPGVPESAAASTALLRWYRLTTESTSRTVCDMRLPPLTPSSHRCLPFYTDFLHLSANGNTAGAGGPASLHLVAAAGRNKEKPAGHPVPAGFSHGRGDWIRTSDLYHPKVFLSPSATVRERPQTPL